MKTHTEIHAFCLQKRRLLRTTASSAWQWVRAYHEFPITPKTYSEALS